VVLAAVGQDPPLGVRQVAVLDDPLEDLALLETGDVPRLFGRDVLQPLAILAGQVVADTSIFPDFDGCQAILGARIGFQFLQAGVQRDGAIPGRRAAGDVLVHVRFGGAGGAAAKAAEPAELDPRKIPRSRRRRRTRHQAAEVLHAVGRGDHVVGVAAADHVPAEVRVVSRFAHRGRRIEQAKHAILGPRDVMPERLVNVFGPIEVDHFIRAGFAVDLGDSTGRFVLDVGVLIVADKRRPGVDVQQVQAVPLGVRGGRRAEMTSPAAGEPIRRLGIIALVFNQLPLKLEQPAVLVQGTAGGSFLHREDGGVGRNGRGQRERADLVKPVVGHRRDVGIVLAGLAVVEVQPGFQAGPANRIRDLTQVRHAARIGVVPKQVPRPFGKRSVREQQDAESAQFGPVDVLVNGLRSRTSGPQIGELLRWRATEGRARRQVEIALDHGHGVQESRLRFRASEQHRRRSAETDRRLGRGRHQDVLVLRPHLGVGLQIAGAQADAEVVVPGGVDPLAQERRTAEVQTQQVDSIDAVPLHGQELEGEIVFGAVDLKRGPDVGRAEVDRQLVFLPRHTRGGQWRSTLVDPASDDRSVRTLGVRHSATAAVGHGQRARRAGCVLDASGLGRQAPERAIVTDRQPQMLRLEHDFAACRRAGRRCQHRQAEETRKRWMGHGDASWAVSESAHQKLLTATSAL